MQESDYQAITVIALIAALADGKRHSEEEFELQRIANAVGGRDYPTLARQVLAGQLRLADVAEGLTTEESRRAAYESAVVVCNADGAANEKEKAFLTELRVALHLDEAAAKEVQAAAGGLAESSPAGPSLGSPEATAPPRTQAEPEREAPRPSQAGIPPVPPDAELDDLILNHAMLAGALELLPQRLASLAIVPLQGRMVYRIGADFGQRLDTRQIADLAGTMGIGAAAQVFEGTARKLFGGVARGMLGRAAGGVTQAAAGAALTFATTWAMGHAAKQYYAQGRALSQADLRALFARLKEEAGELFPKVEAKIQDQAKTLKLGEVMARLRSAV